MWPLCRARHRQENINKTNNHTNMYTEFNWGQRYGKEPHQVGNFLHNWGFLELKEYSDEGNVSLQANLVSVPRMNWNEYLRHYSSSHLGELMTTNKESTRKISLYTSRNKPFKPKTQSIYGGHHITTSSTLVSLCWKYISVQVETA